MYFKLLKVFFCAITLLVGLQAAFCPSGKLSIQKFALLSGNEFLNSSKYYNALYHVKTDTASSQTTLFGYRLNKVIEITSAKFSLSTFSVNAQKGWKVVAISDLGNCILVDQGATLVAYKTSQSSFQIVQTLNEAEFTSATCSQDCLIIRVMIGTTEKVYINSIASKSLTFQNGSIFDSYYVYGIDSSRKLKKIAAGSLYENALDQTLVEDTPVSLLNRRDLNALIMLTKSSSTNKYTLTILNTFNDIKMYSKSWQSFEYSGQFRLQTNNEGQNIIIRDNSGLLLLLGISLGASGLSVTQIQLDEPTDKKYFDSAASISINPGVIITYQNKSLNYFQTFDDVLYFIGSISANLEQSAAPFQDKSVIQPVYVTPTLIKPSELELCYPTATTNTSESDIANQLEDSTAQTITDASGNTVKCQPECLQCKLGGLCEICSLGYALATNGTCVFCAGCRSCHPEKPEVCYGCFKPQVIDSATNKCVDPFCADTNCESCLLGGICESCFKGYSMHNGLCVKCPEGCETCKNSPTECDKGVCQLGFVFFQDPTISTKYFCVECATGCMSCNLADLTDCTQCNEGFYGLRDSDTNALTCAACMSFCRACTSGNTCDRCQTGYKLNADKTKCVENCDDSCKTCSDDDKNFCTGCYSGSNLSDGKCVADLSCNAAKTCTTCGDGYALKTGECLQCTYTDRNCMGCGSSDLTACLKCVTGFYLSPTRACVKCKPECSGCLNENACFSCSKGFYISKLAGSATGKCLACDVECKTCNQYGYLCTSCPDNYTLEGFKCISNNRVEFSVVIGAEASQFVTIAKEFVQQLIASANQNLQDGMKPLTAKDVVLNKIKSGSSVISGAISTKSESFGAAVSSGLKNDLSSMSIGGYPVIGVTSEQKVIITTPADTGSNSDNADKSVRIIVGIMIPIGILVIALIVVIIRKLIKRREQIGSYKDSEEFNEKRFSYDNDSVKSIQKIHSQDLSEKI